MSFLLMKAVFFREHFSLIRSSSIIREVKSNEQYVTLHIHYLANSTSIQNELRMNCNFHLYWRSGDGVVEVTVAVEVVVLTGLLSIVKDAKESI